MARGWWTTSFKDCWKAQYEADQIAQAQQGVREQAYREGYDAGYRAGYDAGRQAQRAQQQG